MSLQRWKLWIEYDGRPYCGWQRQEDGIPSVQQKIEDALFKFCQQDCRLHVAGRTDAGVHADGQVAHFDLDYGDRPLDPYTVIKAINAHLQPEPIAILNAARVPDSFHARFSAVNKLYIYRVLNRIGPPTTQRGRVWHVWGDVNVPAMRQAAAHLLGTHDFSTFRAAECQAKSPVRSLDRLNIVSEPCEHGGQSLAFMVEARSFLHHQVRNMVGTLMLVGQGRWEAEEVRRALDAADRKRGGPTAPPDGLSLVRIDYPE